MAKIQDGCGLLAMSRQKLGWVVDTPEMSRCHIFILLRHQDVILSIIAISIRYWYFTMVSVAIPKAPTPKGPHFEQVAGRYSQGPSCMTNTTHGWPIHDPICDPHDPWLTHGWSTCDPWLTHVMTHLNYWLTHVWPTWPMVDPCRTYGWSTYGLCDPYMTHVSHVTHDWPMSGPYMTPHVTRLTHGWPTIHDFYDLLLTHG